MAKGQLKKLKAQAAQKAAAPLGTRAPIATPKDDEERKLESILFGTPYVPSAAGNEMVIDLGEEEDDDTEGGEGSGEGAGGKEMEGMADGDLFYVDEGESGPKDDAFADYEPPASDASDSEDEGEDAGPSTSAPAPAPIPSTSAPTDRKRKPPAWSDPTDPTLLIPLTSHRSRKLRDAPTETALSGPDYERRLRRQFELINPAPEWASSARKKARQANQEQEDLSNVVSGVLNRGSGGRNRVIAQGTLDISRLPDANVSSSATSSSPIQSLQFHPSPSVPLLATASSDRRIKLFTIDGHTNPLLQTLHIPALPPTSVQFHPGGGELLISGKRPVLVVHDLQSGFTRTSPRGLWGATFGGANGESGEGMEVSAFSPSGDVLAVAGRGGHVHLVDWKAGMGQVIGSLKTGSGESVKSLWWDAERVVGMTGESEVYVWDVGERRCVRRWMDEGGGYRGSGRVMGGGRGYCGVGSASGFVNVYSSQHALAESSTTKKPKPLKSIANLKTPISLVKFNHDSQLMAIASKEVKDAMRLIHIPSLTSFSNWPNAGTPLGTVTSLDFSPTGEYLAVGNTRGRALVWGLGGYRSQS